MSLLDAIAHGPIQAHEAHLLPIGLPVDHYPPSDPRRAMSPQNKSTTQRQRIGSMLRDKIPTKSPSKPTDSTLKSVQFPDVLAPQTPDTSHRFVNSGMLSYMGNLTTDDHDDDIVIVASALLLDISGLIDGGANGGLASPNEMRRLNYVDPPRRVNVTGVGEHSINGLAIGTYAAKIRTSHGYIIGIFHEYGELKNGKTIHSALQLRDGGNTVDDTAMHLGGRQRITTSHGHIIPLDFENGLPYIKMQLPSDDDLVDYPHVIMTRDVPWDPKRYDLKQSDDEDLFAALAAEDGHIPLHDGFNDFGELISAHLGEVTSDHGERCGEPSSARVSSTGELLPPPNEMYYNFYDGWCPTYSTEVYAHVAVLGRVNFETLYSERSLQPIEYEQHRRFFLNVPASTVRSTFDCTTQYYRHIPSSNHIFMTYRSPYPALNIFRRRELVASDTVFADTVAWGGWKAAQVFVGRLSQYIGIHGCKTDKDFCRTLEDEIRKRGAMDKIVTDRAKAEISKKVQEVLRALFIDDWQSEPYFHHQLFAERIIQELKKFANWVLNWSDAPPQAWLLVFEYVAFIMNRTAKEKLGWRTPVEALTGNTPDISILMHFTFWEPVFIKNYRGSGKNFPSESNEILVRFVGYSESVGHSITFKVFNEDTQEILYRSCLRKVDENVDVVNVPPYDPGAKGGQGDPNDKGIPQVIKLRGSDDTNVRRSPTISPEELIGRTFLTNPQEDGQRFRAKILSYEDLSAAMDEFHRDLENNKARGRFKVKVGGKAFEEYVEWDEMCDFIEEQNENEDGTWNFRKIMGHKKDRKPKEKPQVLIQWESGEITYNDIDLIYDADPYGLAEYARDHNLIDEWEKEIPRLKLHRHAKNVKKMFRAMNQAKLKSYRTSTVYMYGYKVPRNHEECVQFDKENGDNKWVKAEELERMQLFEYDVFDDRGHKSKARVPAGYKKIRLSWAYAVKHDGRFKARCVARGDLTDPPNESVYSGVVTLRGVRLCIFLAELNGLKVWQTDVGNAYLEANTTEKVYVIAGSEFDGLKDHVLIIVKSLYGLRTSGKRWYERFSDVLRDMGFFPCFAEPEIWMRACNPDGSIMSSHELRKEEPAFTYDGVTVPILDGYYEYIACYCDDLTIASKDPEAIAKSLTDVHKFKLKGTAPLNFLLGCNYFRDKNGTMCSSPSKYIEKMESTFARLFPNEDLVHKSSPLPVNDHPEIDTTSLLGEDGIKIYQSMVGAAQWIVSLGRFDIAVQVMTMSSFRAAPRQGHLERMKHIYGYISKMRHGTLRYRTDIPNFSDIDYVEHDWSRTVYAGAREEYPHNLPAARGMPVLQWSYVDANLYHDMLTGKAVTGVLHYINQTPIDWYSKKQATVETATFGSENSAARTAIEQMKDLKLTLLYLGVPIIDRSILFGDNKSVVDSDSQPHSKLHKRHLMLSYHYVREAVASGNYAYCWLRGQLNPSDVLSKHWGRQAVWPVLQRVMFWYGDTLNATESHPNHD